jgi:uncharacterized NAD(P)/FAD-binding protein YdhS
MPIPAPADVPHIVIVGGGFSGAVTAINLARALSRPTIIDIVEPRSILGAGVAYAATDPAHRINVPASRMTVFADDPTQFDRWLHDQSALAGDPDALWEGDHAFPKRALFGQYIAELVADAAKARPDIQIRHHRARVTEIQAHAHGFTVQLDAGEPLTADLVILAVSHPPPAIPAALRDALAQGAPIVTDPWPPAALDHIAADAAVLIVGTGLTMADVVATLDRRSHRGPIIALSRRGLLSRGHNFAPGAAREVFKTALPPATALALSRAVRAQVRQARSEGMPWQSVFDDVRAHALRLWSALPEAEQRRLLRHLRPFWDVHRFRVSPQAEAAIARLRATGQLQTLAASLTSADWDGDALTIRIQPRHAPVKTLRADAAIVTTGPAHGSILHTNPALDSLARQGLIRADGLGLGIEVDQHSRAIGQDGTAARNLFIAGPLARGRFGELMGLPQVSEHAAAVAKAASLTHPTA